MDEKVVIKRLVLDVMKPHKPSLIQVGRELSELNGVDGCNITTIEIDKSVENVKITVDGTDIDYEQVESVLDENGSTVHSVDKLSVGKKSKKLVEEAKYRPQR